MNVKESLSRQYFNHIAIHSYSPVPSDKFPMETSSIMDIPVLETTNKLISSQDSCSEDIMEDYSSEIPLVMFKKTQTISSDSGNSDSDYTDISTSCCDLMGTTDEQPVVNKIVENYLNSSENEMVQNYLSSSENEIAESLNTNMQLGVSLSEDDGISLGSRRSSTASEYFDRLERGIPKPPPLPDLELCRVSVVRRSSHESDGSVHSVSSLERRRHSLSLHDFTHKIHDKACKILGKIGLTGEDSREFFEFHIKKEEILPIDPVEAEQTRNIIQSFLNEGQVIATTEFEVLEELECQEPSPLLDDGQAGFASSVATALPATHDFQDPEYVAEIYSHDLEECSLTELNSGNEQQFIRHFREEPRRFQSADSLPFPDHEDAAAMAKWTLKESLKSQENEQSETGSKPGSPHVYRINFDSPYKRLR